MKFRMFIEDCLTAVLRGLFSPPPWRLLTQEEAAPQTRGEIYAELQREVNDSRR